VCGCVVCVFARACLRLRVFCVCARTRVHVFVRAHVCVCVRVCVYVYIYIYCQQRTKNEIVIIHHIKVGRGGDCATPLLLISALGAGEWSPSHPCSFIPRKEPLYPLKRRLGGPQRRSGWSGEEIIFFPLRELTSWTDQPAAGNYTD